MGPKQVEVTTDKSTHLLTGAQVFINTGATPRMPDIPGLKETPGVYTSAGLMEVDVLPKRLVIIGAGYIGLEFASMYAAFGSEVTVLQHNDAFLPNEDADIADEIKRLLEEQGITFMMNTQTTSVRAGDAGLLLDIDQQGEVSQLKADAVLVATGRVPNTQALNLEAAGIEVTERGAIQVDDLLRTTAPDVWALGDVAGSAQHTYISLDDFRIVWAQLNDQAGHGTNGRKNVPYSVFLRTPYARVGMNEQEAKEQGHQVRVAKLPAAAIPKAHVLGRPQGFTKAIMDKETDRILGAMLLCEEAYEVINIIKLAMDYGADAKVMHNQIFTHPTMAEALNDLFAG